MNNSKKIRAAITGVAHWVPEKVLTNKDLEKMVDTSDEWITSRTGIKERRILENGSTSDLGANAAKKLLEEKGINPDEIELIIVATVTPDMSFPPTAAIIQRKIGATKCWGFDVSAACSSYLFTLTTAAQFVENGTYKKVLVIGADKMSSITDYTDRNTCILFGDAGTATLLEPMPAEDNIGIMDHILHIDGNGEDFLNMKGGGSRNPTTIETVQKKWHYIYQDGKAVFKVAVVGMANVSAEIVERNNLKPDDIAYLVPHQANLRIIDATANRMGIDRSKVMINIHKYGNTTAATIPMCLSEYYRDGKLKKGDNLILAAFGAGWTWGSIYLRWAY
jgi:3-oxoacyl-[acyl-carrier-protein] synthase III